MDNASDFLMCLVGRDVLLKQGLRGQIQDAYCIGLNSSANIKRAVLAIQLELPERGYLYSPQTGVNLTGQIYAPISDIGRKLLILD